MKTFGVQLISGKKFIKADRYLKEGDRFVFYNAEGVRIEELLCEDVEAVRMEDEQAPSAEATEPRMSKCRKCGRQYPAEVGRTCLSCGGRLVSPLTRSDCLKLAKVGLSISLLAAVFIYVGSKAGWLQGLPPEQALKGAICIFALFAGLFIFMFLSLLFVASPVGQKCERFGEKYLAPVVGGFVIAVIIYILMLLMKHLR